MQINNSYYSIIELLSMLDRRELVVNKDYQRGSGLWPAGPASYFIDTILEGFPFPKIYMYEFLHLAGKEMRKEIVDGQQRISAIKRFAENEIRLAGDTKYSGMRFEDLPKEKQDEFLSYTVAVDVIRNATTGDILQMFRRMNAYTMPLNEAEKRHSGFQGRFKWFVNELADQLDGFFTDYGVLTNREIIRMADASLLTEIFVALEKGIVSSSPTDLRAIYRKYDEDFPLHDEFRVKVAEAVDYIATHFSDLRRTHLMKQYAFQSLVIALVFNRWGIPSISDEFGIQPLGRFAEDPNQSQQTLLAMAQAHEAKELEGPYQSYVWGCMSSTHRKARRTTRLCSILRALGTPVAEEIDGDLVTGDS